MRCPLAFSPFGRTATVSSAWSRRASAFIMATPLAYDPVAWARAIAASFAEISSRAWNRSDTGYAWPLTRPTLFGVTEAAMADVTTLAREFSTGISASAVSTFSVLAGRKCPCGSLAASTCPVPASAIT